MKKTSKKMKNCIFFRNSFYKNAISIYDVSLKKLNGSIT